MRDIPKDTIFVVFAPLTLGEIGSFWRKSAPKSIREKRFILRGVCSRLSVLRLSLVAESIMPVVVERVYVDVFRVYAHDL